MAAQRLHKTQTYSKRASILADVLDWINSGYYDAGDDYILFGRESIYDLVDDLTQREQEHNTDRRALQELVSDIKIHSGRDFAAERTSLGSAPKLSGLRGARDLSPAARQHLVAWLQEQISRSKSKSTSAQPQSIEDALDATYANEVVQKLEKIVRR